MRVAIAIVIAFSRPEHPFFCLGFNLATYFRYSMHKNQAGFWPGIVAVIVISVLIVAAGVAIIAVNNNTTSTSSTTTSIVSKSSTTTENSSTSSSSNNTASNNNAMAQNVGYFKNYSSSRHSSPPTPRALRSIAGMASEEAFLASQ